MSTEITRKTIFYCARCGIPFT